jgi:hypothetical protein
MPDDVDSQQAGQREIDEGILKGLLSDALQHGDHDQLLELTRELLDQWPRQRVRNSMEWWILAMLSQVGSDGRRFGFAATEISRKVALTARLSYYRTTSNYDVVCRTVALSAFEELSLPQVMKCLMVEGHMGHYAASRLGLAAFQQRNVEVLEHCVKRSRNFDAKKENIIDYKIELALLECYCDILKGSSPDIENLIQLLRDTSQEFRERYYHTVNTLLDLDDVSDLQVG